MLLIVKKCLCLIVYMEIYIIDTGVDASHGQFLGKDKKTRVEIGQSFGDKNAQVHSSDVRLLLSSLISMGLTNLN